MTPANLPDLVETILVEHLRCEDRFSWDTPLAELGADELHTITLAQCFDERFGIEIDDHAAERCRTAGDWLACVASRVEHNGMPEVTRGAGSGAVSFDVRRGNIDIEGE